MSWCPGASALVLEVVDHFDDDINKCCGYAYQIKAAEQEKEKVDEAGLRLSGCHAGHGEECLLSFRVIAHRTKHIRRWFRVNLTK